MKIKQIQNIHVCNKFFIDSNTRRYKNVKWLLSTKPIMFFLQFSFVPNNYSVNRDENNPTKTMIICSVVLQVVFDKIRNCHIHILSWLFVLELISCQDKNVAVQSYMPMDGGTWVTVNLSFSKVESRMV